MKRRMWMHSNVAGRAASRCGDFARRITRLAEFKKLRPCKQPWRRLAADRRRNQPARFGFWAWVQIRAGILLGWGARGEAYLYSGFGKGKNPGRPYKTFEAAVEEIAPVEFHKKAQARER